MEPNENRNENNRNENSINQTNPAPQAETAAGAGAEEKSSQQAEQTSQQSQTTNQTANQTANPSGSQGQGSGNGPQSSYHSAYEHYQQGGGFHSGEPHRGRGPQEPPMDDLHRELRHFRKMATVELVVIAVLAGLSGGLVTYTVANRRSQDVIASQQETIRGMQEDQKDQNSGSSNDGGNNSGNGAQMIPFFGGAEPGSGSESGESGSSGSSSGTEEADPSQIETTVQLGIYCTGVTEDVSEAYDIPSGVVVADFSEENSNAEKAGLQKGDVITKIDDTGVTSVTELKKALQNYNPGDKVTLTIERRSGSEYTEKKISFALEAKEDASDEATK